MANLNPSKATRCQLGRTGNPNGSSKRRRLLGEIRQLTHAQLAEVGTLVLCGDVMPFGLTTEITLKPKRAPVGRINGVSPIGAHVFPL